MLDLSPSCRRSAKCVLDAGSTLVTYCRSLHQCARGRCGGSGAAPLVPGANGPPREGKQLIVTLHQPVFSADSVHGGSESMLELIHEPARRAGCRLVISGHVHNYQRFEYEGITYLVAGGGGYYGLHGLLPPEFPGAMYPIVSHTRDHSFVHITVTPERLTLRAIAVPERFTSRKDAPYTVDTFTVETAATHC